MTGLTGTRERAIFDYVSKFFLKYACIDITNALNGDTESGDIPIV